MPRTLIDLPMLELSPTVANCRINREREIRGTKSDAVELGRIDVCLSSEGAAVLLPLDFDELPSGLTSASSVEPSLSAETVESSKLMGL